MASRHRAGISRLGRRTACGGTVDLAAMARGYTRGPGAATRTDTRCAHLRYDVRTICNAAAARERSLIETRDDEAPPPRRHIRAVPCLPRRGAGARPRRARSRGGGWPDRDHARAPA